MKALAVYVHVPFCTVKCGYCDFNAYAGMDGLKDAYVGAVVRELWAWGPLIRRRAIRSVAFGGGTPGEMKARQIARVLGALESLEPGSEVSLEANPGTSSLRFLAGVSSAGVNRVTFGAQSFDPGELRFLDRIHSAEATRVSVRNARGAGIRSVGLDLIYGLPGQRLASWTGTLGAALALEPDHVSCYALTVEPGTGLAARVERQEVQPLDVDSVADMYEAATDILERAGYRQYEISNWARPGHESQHNRVYWTDGDYLGVGAGAHGYIDGERYENIAHPRAYVETVVAPGRRSQEDGRGAGPGGREGEPGVVAGVGTEEAHGPGEPRSPIDLGPAIAARHPSGEALAMADFVALRLRLTDGLQADDFRSRFGAELGQVAGPVLDDCIAAGVLERVRGGVRLTRRGRLLHGEVSARLLSHLRTAARGEWGA